MGACAKSAVSCSFGGAARLFSCTAAGGAECHSPADRATGPACCGGLGAALCWRSGAAGHACAAVLVGNTVSEGVSCLLMAAFAGREPSFRRQSGDPARGFTGRELLLIALPVEGSRLAVSALQAVESSLIPLCLAMYLGDRSAAVAQYGALKGMALPLIFSRLRCWGLVRASDAGNYPPCIPAVTAPVLRA